MRPRDRRGGDPTARRTEARHHDRGRTPERQSPRRRQCTTAAAIRRVSHEVEARSERRLRRGNPFKQMAPGDAQAPSVPADRIGHQPRLIRQERDGQRRERQGKTEIAAERRTWLEIVTPGRRGGMAA